jgi:hypothetical protein
VRNPANPQPDGTISMGGETTSVAVRDPRYALVAVNTSPDFVNPSGELAVIDIARRSIVRTIDLGGQPDAIAVAPNRRYAAIAIENERDEDFNGGIIPQAPPGKLVILRMFWFAITLVDHGRGFDRARRRRTLRS